MPAMSKTRTVYLQTFTTDVHLRVLLFVRLWLFLYYVPFMAHCEIELKWCSGLTINQLESSQL